MNKLKIAIDILLHNQKEQTEKIKTAYLNYQAIRLDQTERSNSHFLKFLEDDD